MVPFHDLWTDGGETEKRPPCPPRVTEPAQTHGSYFWDTTLDFGLKMSRREDEGEEKSPI